MAIVGFAVAVAQEIGLPPIGGYYILNLLYPLWILPIFGSIRLAHPKSYYAYWFYRCNPAKYFRAVQRFGLEAEYADLVARQVSELTDDERKYIQSMQRLIDTGTVWKLSGFIRKEAERFNCARTLQTTTKRPKAALTHTMQYPVWWKNGAELAQMRSNQSRSSQPMAVVKSRFDFMKQFPMFATLAAASVSSAPTR